MLKIDQEIPNIELKSNLVVWYRAIHNREIEIIGDMLLPNNEDEIYTFFKYNVLQQDNKYQALKKFIPEYQDIKNNSELSSIMRNKYLDSYTIFMAIYDYKNKNIITMSYGMFDEFFTNLFDQLKLQEAKDLIIKNYEFLSCKYLICKNTHG
jgi:hypothetical protein